MPYTINWYIENEIIYCRYSGECTSDELRNAILAMNDMIDSSPRLLVHHINDVRDVIVPISLRDTLKTVREVGTHDRLGWSITVGEDSAFIKMVIGISSSLLKARARTVDTIDEAQAFIKSMDSTLSWDQVKESVIIR